MTSSAAMTGALEKLSWNYILISVITLITLILFIRRRKFTAHPPCYYGWIPWFGCAFEFGKEPLIFIGDSWKRVCLIVIRFFFIDMIVINQGFFRSRPSLGYVYLTRPQNIQSNYISRHIQ